MGNLTNMIPIGDIMLGADRFREGLDYLRVNFMESVPFFDRLLRKLVTNSESFFDGKYTYTKIALASGECIVVSYSYMDCSVPIMLYNRFGTNKVVKKYARLDFYGSFFRLITVKEFKENSFTSFIKQYTDEVPTISRFDFCFDLFYNDRRPLPTRDSMFSKLNTSSKIYDIGHVGRLEARSVGSKTNKRFIIRMYDKLSDIHAKSKMFQYPDYLQYKAVHRLEFEFGPHFTRGFDLSQLQDLINKAKSYIGIGYEDYDGVMFYNYNGKFEISEYNKTDYIKQYQGRSKKLFDACYNPYIITHDGLSAHCQTQYQKNKHHKHLQQFITYIEK